MSDERDDAPPSEEELVASKRLRDALEDPSIEAPEADLARSLRAAFDPEPIDASAHAQIVDDVPTAEELELAAELRDALDADPMIQAISAAWRPKEINSIEHRQIVAKALPPAAKQGGRVMRVTFGFVAGAVAIAASVVVWMNAPHAQSEVPLARARSTQDLFPSYDGFKSGEASATARIDKIAIARAGDYRDNRFAKWGCPVNRFALAIVAVAAAIALALALAIGCGRDLPSGDANGSPAIDTEVMAYLSEARALHHQANLKEETGDLPGAIGAMERLVAARRPHPEAKLPEVEEVLADAYARLAELELKRNGLPSAARAIDSGLAHAPEPTYFRGHLIEVQGLIMEANANELADAGKKEEAEKAKRKAIEILEEVVKIQDQVIMKSLAGRDGGTEAPR